GVVVVGVGGHDAVARSPDKVMAAPGRGGRSVATALRAGPRRTPRRLRTRAVLGPARGRRGRLGRLGRLPAWPPGPRRPPGRPARPSAWWLRPRPGRPCERAGARTTPRTGGRSPC